MPFSIFKTNALNRIKMGYLLTILFILLTLSWKYNEVWKREKRRNKKDEIRKLWMEGQRILSEVIWWRNPNLTELESSKTKILHMACFFLKYYIYTYLYTHACIHMNIAFMFIHICTHTHVQTLNTYMYTQCAYMCKYTLHVNAHTYTHIYAYIIFFLQLQHSYKS